MFLTPPSPSRTKIFSKFPNEPSPPSIPSDDAAAASALAPARANNLPPLQVSTARDMTTPHRGLDHGLPAGMILPDPLRQPQQPAPRVSSHPLPTSVRQLQTYEREDYSRPWQSKPSIDQVSIEEHKWKQEEEKRKQEELKLKQEEHRSEQRRIEQEMLRESIAKGIHPNLVPLIFVGLGGAASGAGGGFEMAQQYITQFQSVGLQVQSQLQNTSSPNFHRELRTAVPLAPHQYSTNHQNSAPMITIPQGVSPAVAAAVYPSPAYHSPRGQVRPTTQPSRFASVAGAASQPLAQSSLPRLTTNEAQVQAGAPITSASHSQHPQGQATTQATVQAAPQNTDHASPSPSGIYFHHWQPPVSQGSAGKESQKTSPQNRPGNATETTAASPKKRKATGAHQAQPPPTSAPYNPGSPTFSTTSTGSKRPGRRRSSGTSGLADRDLSSRAQSNEPGHHPGEATSQPQVQSVSQPAPAVSKLAS